MKKILKVIVCAALSINLLLVAGIVIMLISAPLFNDLAAADAANSLAAAVPQDSECIDRISCAGKLVGCGNGTQCFGAVLIRSGLSLDELRKYYAGIDKYSEVEPQNGTEIDVLEHRHLRFDADMDESGSYYIVYTWGKTNDLFSDLDLRGH